MSEQLEEFLKALNGERGELDAWLEVRDEAEVRAAMNEALEYVKEANKFFDALAATPAQPPMPEWLAAMLDDYARLSCDQDFSAADATRSVIDTAITALFVAAHSAQLQDVCVDLTDDEGETLEVWWAKGLGNFPSMEDWRSSWDTPSETTDADKVDAYYKSLGLYGTYSVDDLIESHRRLREMSVMFHEERSLEIDKARAIAREQARAAVEHGEYISVEKLRTMTLGEIVELIQD